METVIVKSQYEIERNKPIPSKHHSIIQSNLSALFFVKYKHFRALSELSLIVNGKEKVPDIAIYKKEDFDITIEEVKTTQIPLGVVEILSLTQNITELLEKSHHYFEAGVQSYWLIVPPLKIVFVFHQANNYKASFEKDEVLVDEVLGVEFNLNNVFF